MIAEWNTNCVFLAAMLEDRHPEVFKRLQQTLVSHGVEVRLLKHVRDYWAKDYSPIQVGPRKLIKFRYDPDYLKDDPLMRTGDEVVKSFRHIGRCRRSTIVLDGGNVVASRNKAILTDKIYKENPERSRTGLRNELRQLLQVDQLIVVPKEPYEPCGHTDAMVRFIDESTVLVNDYSEVDPDFGERLLKVLRRHQLAIETLPYSHEKQSRKGIPSAVGCFANFLRTEKVIVSPVFGTDEDTIALRKIESVFPKVPLVPLDCTDLAREGGVVNCISASYRIQPNTLGR